VCALERNFEIEICLGLGKYRFVIHIHNMCPVSLSLGCLFAPRFLSLSVPCLCLDFSVSRSPLCDSVSLCISCALSFTLTSSLVGFAVVWHLWLCLSAEVSVSGLMTLSLSLSIFVVIRGRVLGFSWLVLLLQEEVNLLVCHVVLGKNGKGLWLTVVVDENGRGLVWKCDGLSHFEMPKLPSVYSRHVMSQLTNSVIFMLLWKDHFSNLKLKNLILTLFFSLYFHLTLNFKILYSNKIIIYISVKWMWRMNSDVN